MTRVAQGQSGARGAHMRTAQRITGLPVGGRALALVAMTIALTFLVFSSSALASSSPPEVQTEPAEAIPGGAKLKGKLNPGGLPSTYYFIYARETCDEGCTPSKTATGGPLMGDTEQEVPAVEVTGLSGSGGAERYWYILVASNADGTVYGELVNFTPGASIPSINSESVSHVTSTDATLEAKINPESLQRGVDYQFQLVANTGEYLPVFACPTEGFPANSSFCGGPLASQAGALPIGTTGAGVQGKTVSLDLSAPRAWWSGTTTLKPGTTYHYRVIAARSVPTEDTIQWEDPIVYGPDQTFTTPSAGTAPVIESISISHLTPTDATLEAQIDTEDLSTSYEFQLWSSPCSHKGAGCDLIINVPLPTGLLLGSFVSQNVSLDLNSAGVTLGGGEYGFSVLATNKAGSTSAFGGIFEAPPGVLDPPSPGTSSLPAAGNQPIEPNSDGQPAGSGSTSSSPSPLSAPNVTVLGSHMGKTTKPASLTDAQKLAKALKACKKKPAGERAACERQARKKYGTSGKKSKR
jgi:hypothetical protein